MIKRISSNNPINYVLMLVLMLLLWSFKFYFMPTPMEAYQVNNWLIPELPETIFFKYLSAILSFVFLYMIAILVVRYNSRLSIVENGYQSSGIIFILLTGVFINAQRILPETIASLSLFIALMRIFSSYKYNKAYTHMLDAGILTSISILLFHKLIFFIPIFIIALFIVRPVSLREMIIYIIGLILTFLVGVAIIWLWGKPDMFLSSLESAIGTKFTYEKYNILNIIIFAPILLLSFVSILSRFTISTAKKISTRKFQTTIVIILIVMIVYFISPHATNESIIIIWPFLALMYSNIIINAKKRFAKLTFWSFVISIVVSQYIQITHYLSLV